MKQYIMHVLGSVSQELYFPDAHLTDIIEILILTYLIGCRLNFTRTRFVKISFMDAFLLLQGK